MNTLLPLCILSLLCTQDGDTPLHLAAWKGNVESVKLLVQNGANVQIANKVSYCSPIHCCCDLYLLFSACISCVPGVSFIVVTMNTRDLYEIVGLCKNLRLFNLITVFA